MKLVLGLIYNINIKDSDMDYINKVTKTYVKVSKSIYHQIQYL